MSTKVSFGNIDAAATRCTVLDANGELCGRAGQPGLPLGVCLDHALAVYRAVVALMQKGVPA